MVLLNNQQISKDIESKRRLFLQKDLFELAQWVDDLEFINTDLNAMSTIEKQLIKKSAIVLKIQGLRRKNTLSMSALCKYEQLIKNEIEYGKANYDIIRSKEHEKQRAIFLEPLKDYRNLREEFNKYLFQFQKR